MRSSIASQRACIALGRCTLRDTAARPAPLPSHTKCTRQRHRVALPRVTAELSALTDPWSVSSSETLASGLFAASLAPYLVFLWQLNRAKGPKLMNFGFAFLLVFVGATIPAGIYAKTAYGTSLANVDWLHGTAESLLTVTNTLIVLGLRQALRGGDEQRE